MTMSLSFACFLVFLCVVSYLDYKTKSIYDLILISGAVIIFPVAVVSDGYRIPFIVNGMVWGIGSYGMIYLSVKLFYGEELFGFGDVLLNGVIGGYLGLKSAAVSSFLTFFVALLWIVLKTAVTMRFDRDTEVPLAPFMSVSAVAAYYFTEGILRWIL